MHIYRDRQIPILGPDEDVDAQLAGARERDHGFCAKGTVRRDRAGPGGPPRRPGRPPAGDPRTAHALLRCAQEFVTNSIEGRVPLPSERPDGPTGARWSLTGVEAVLRLRALRASGDFDDYWAFRLAKEHERTHQSRYADGAVPNPLTSRRPQLKLVK